LKRAVGGVCGSIALNLEKSTWRITGVGVAAPLAPAIAATHTPAKAAARHECMLTFCPSSVRIVECPMD